jgi:hypothetical protein
MKAPTIINEPTQLVPVDSLIPHPLNPRQGDVGAIHESIQANGFYGVVVVQKSTNYVLAGNHRLKAAAAAGMTEVPAILVDVDDDRAKRILLADNRTNDLASYDLAALSDILQDMTPDLSGTGYDGDALDNMLADMKGDLDGYGDKNKEIDADALLGDGANCCPRCGFEFEPDE